jgi:hypothetical protein
MINSTSLNEVHYNYLTSLLYAKLISLKVRATFIHHDDGGC